MRRSALAQIALRTLAYAELAAAGDDDDGCEVLALLMQAVTEARSPDTAEAALGQVIESLGKRMVQVSADRAPASRRGSMRYG